MAAVTAICTLSTPPPAPRRHHCRRLLLLRLHLPLVTTGDKTKRCTSDMHREHAYTIWRVVQVSPLCDLPCRLSPEECGHGLIYVVRVMAPVSMHKSMDFQARNSPSQPSLEVFVRGPKSIILEFPAAPTSAHLPTTGLGRNIIQGRCDMQGARVIVQKIINFLAGNSPSLGSPEVFGCSPKSIILASSSAPTPVPTSTGRSWTQKGQGCHEIHGVHDHAKSNQLAGQALT